MASRDWNPDPKVIEKLKLQTKDRQNDRIAIGGRVVTWEELIQEVEKGTPSGRRYYNAYVECLNESGGY